MPESVFRLRNKRDNDVAGGDGSSKRERHLDADATRTSPTNKATVAELSMDDVRRMSCEELLAAIRAADVPLFRGSALGHLGYCDRPTLERMLFLARRTVRNQGY